MSRSVSVEPMIIFDQAEIESTIPELLQGVDIKTVRKRLPYGDYVIIGKNTYCVERKTVPDLFRSLRDKTIFRQLYDMSVHFAKSFLIIEGNLDMYLNNTGYSKDTILGFFVSVSMRTSGHGMHGSISYLPSSNAMTTASILKGILKRANEEEEKYFEPQVEGVKTQLHVGIRRLSQFPGINHKKAKMLLNHFKSEQAVLNATKEEFCAVRGFGERTYHRIHKALNEIYPTVGEHNE